MDLEHPSWTELHDATLVGFELDWASGALKVRLVMGGRWEGTWTIDAEGTTGLDVPRVHDWGPSASILEARCLTAVRGARLELVMQSGDTIRIEARRIGLPKRTRE